jgi:hypothetical protein
LDVGCPQPLVPPSVEKREGPSVVGADSSRKGGRRGKKDESDVHLPQPQKKGSYLLYFIFVF